MSHRYREKVRITGEGEESVRDPPHPLDFFSLEPEFFLTGGNYEKLSEKDREALNRYLMGTVPVAMSYILASRDLEIAVRKLQRDYGLTENEARLLIEAVFGRAEIEIDERFQRDGGIQLEISYLLSPENSESPEEPQHE